MSTASQICIYIHMGNNALLGKQIEDRTCLQAEPHKNVGKHKKKGIHLAKEERRILYVSFHVREDKASQGEVWNDRDAMQSHRNEPRKKRCTINTAAGLQPCCTRHQQFIFSLSISMDGSRGQPKQLVYQDLQPPTEWNETVHNHILRVRLPGRMAMTRRDSYGF